MPSINRWQTGTLTEGQMKATQLWFHNSLLSITGPAMIPEGTFVGANQTTVDHRSLPEAFLQVRALGRGVLLCGSGGGRECVDLCLIVLLFCHTRGSGGDGVDA